MVAVVATASTRIHSISVIPPMAVAAEEEVGRTALVAKAALVTKKAAAAVPGEAGLAVRRALRVAAVLAVAVAQPRAAPAAVMELLAQQAEVPAAA